MATPPYPADGPRAEDFRPGDHATEEVEEFPLLLQRSLANALIEAAHRQGFTAGALVLGLIADYLRRQRRDLQ
jgi:hypothetical protein